MCSIGFQQKNKWSPNPPIEKATIDVIDCVKNAGFQAIEFWQPHIGSLHAADLSRVIARLQHYAMAVPMLSAYYNFTKSSQHAEASVAKGHTVIEQAKAIGANNIRIFTGNHRSADASPEQWRRCVACLQELADHAAEHGIGLAAETHDWNLMDTLPGCLRLHDLVDRNNFGFIFQASTFGAQQYMWALKHLAPAVRHVHAPPSPTLQTGLYDYRAIFAHLKKTGISCYASLEYFGPEPERAACSDGKWLQHVCAQS